MGFDFVFVDDDLALAVADAHGIDIEDIRTGAYPVIVYDFSALADIGLDSRIPGR